MIVEDNLSVAQVARIFKCSPSAVCASLDIALGRGGHPKSGLRRFLDDLGVYGKNSIKKFIPSLVFTIRRKKLALFLNRLYACDGWMTTDEGRVEIGYATSSKRMARQVQHILLRFGILSVLREKRTSTETAYSIIIQNTHFVKKFIDEIGGFRGDEKTEKIRLLCECESNPNIDTIPKQVWSIVEEIRQKRGISWADVGFMSSKKNYAPSRKTLKKIARALHSPHLLNLAESDVFWDEVASIKDVGEKRVYDLSMNPTSNFLANDIFVHNTALGMKFLSWYGHNTDRKCYGIGYTDADLPQWIGKAGSLEDIPNDSVVLIDEAAILFFSREAMKSMNKTLSKLMSVARHKNLTLILITQSSAMVDLNVLRLADVLLFKEPSLLQARFERKSLKDLFEKVDTVFEEIEEEKVAHFYVFSDEYEGLVQYDLPYFWNDSISRAFKEFKAEEK
ncbi:hypothetical protein AKJ48_02620 [candidate division MSBL1 archaeon SCGC-AAA261O19]|nr:hypothetical protein AKJ48_02620 [candidate division MSBL1 archaeon SCGC-AAA261O19]